VAGDVGDEAAVINMFNIVYVELGAVTALVNSAGISLKRRPFIELDAQDLTNLLSADIAGTILCTLVAVKQMSTKSGGVGGAIVNVSFMATTMGGRLGAEAFAVLKGEVDIFTKGPAKEAADEGIRINAVRPGQTHSDMTYRLKNPEIIKAMAETIPMGRIAWVEEIVELVMWLLSENASFVTGAIVDAGGGRVTIGPENPLLVGQSF
jgi:NAD(P)-dependent dehydrogenase (short-subunit alcohol dehydrogenase family)